MTDWTLQDQLDWEIIREGPEDLAKEVSARRPDLVKLWEDAVQSVLGEKT